MESPHWSPSDETIGASNLFRLMRERGVETFDAIQAWSTEYPEDFWARTIQTLGIRMSKPYQRLLDCSAGRARARWMVGAKLNIADSCFKRKADEIAIVAGGHGGPIDRVTFDRLDRLSNRVANGLVRIGIRKGDAVAVYLTMTVEAVAIYLGVVKMGGVVVSISESFPPEEIAKRLRIGNAAVVFAQEAATRGGKSLPLYEKVCRADAPRAVVLAAEQSPASPLRGGDLKWESFLSSDERFESVPCSPHDPINILFSSGTTGDPKAIPWDHTTPIRSASDAHHHHDLAAGDVVCWPTSLGWMMGPWLIFATLINDAAIALYDGSPMERGFCEFVQDARVTMLGVVPSIVSGWRKSGRAGGLDWSPVRTFSSSGEASNADDYGWLMRANQPAGVVKPVIEYCGGTELGGGYLTSNLLTPQRPGEFNGKTMGIDFVVLDDDGRTVGPGETGEAFLVPPSLGMSGRLINGDNDAVYYADCPSWNGIPLRRHGDRITVRGGGRYQSAGRADDTMNLGGIKIGSAEIERCVGRIPGVLDVAAVGVPPTGGGADRLVLFVVAERPDALADAGAIFRRRIKEHLNPLFHVHEVVAIDSLPRTASNKVLHRELRKRYQAAEA